MSIDTAMRNLSMYDIDDCGNAKLYTWYNGIEEDMEESFKVAIETIHKYQKIQEIMKSKKMNALNIGLLIPKDMACVLHEIKEVMEDGNDKI